MDAVRIWISCRPPERSAQQKKLARRPDGKGGHNTFPVQNPEYQKQKLSLTAILMTHKAKPPVPIECAVDLTLILCWRYRTSEPKKNRLMPVPKVTRPDPDNIVKLYLDAFVGAGWLSDDSIVGRLVVCRRWTRYPGIGIILEPDRGVVGFPESMKSPGEPGGLLDG